MRIHTTEITPAQIDACLARMKASPFKAAVIAFAAMDAGILDYRLAQQLADRLIQKQRQLGNIHVTQPYPTWLWVGKKP